MTSDSDSDSDSAYEQGSPNTEDPALADIFSLDLLISRVEEMQRRGQLELLQKLSIDNSRLQHLVIAYQRQWCGTVELLGKTREAVLLLQRALERCFGESMVAERGRLAFWGIEQRDGKACSYRPAGWI
jgi:hypothetical protein